MLYDRNTPELVRKSKEGVLRYALYANTVSNTIQQISNWLPKLPQNIYADATTLWFERKTLNPKRFRFCYNYSKTGVFWCRIQMWDLFCFQIQCISLLNWSSKNARHPLRLFWNISNFTFKGIYNPPDNIRIKIGKAIIEALFEFGKIPHNCILDVIKVNIYNLPKLKLTLKRQPSCFTPIWKLLLICKESLPARTSFLPLLGIIYFSSATPALMYKLPNDH